MNVLKAFGFGPGMCQWISTFYNKIKSRVIVNGRTSPWFSIERECRQSDLIAPCLFLLCVGILGTMIRENRSIKGITINDVEHRLAQFADDTQLMSEADVISFEQSISTVDTFSRKSELAMNSSKTQAAWYGGKRRPATKFLPHVKMDWNPPKFKTLGVWFNVDLADCEEINYNDKFSELKMLLNIWIKRTITPLQKNNHAIRKDSYFEIYDII